MPKPKLVLNVNSPPHSVCLCKNPTSAMKDEANPDLWLGDDNGEVPASPALVSLAPFSPIPMPSARRLSSCFLQPSRPVSSLSRPLAWVSLQGRLVNADEASCAQTIGMKRRLSHEHALAWDLFTPVQRFLIVAVIGVAVAESKKNYQIRQLKKSVELRDQVLSSMQQKLDSLCDQMNGVKDNLGRGLIALPEKKEENLCSETFGSDKIKFVDCGCWICDQHCHLFNGSLDSSVKNASYGNEVLQYKLPSSNDAEQEERRMSDLSDWASSSTSVVDVHINSVALEQDICNLKKDSEEKDATIKDLKTLLSSQASTSKRVVELEDIIRRKNSTITRLKKDLVVLEQKVVQLTRLRRSSFPASDSHFDQVLHMRDNLVYDMDNTTSASSSSDSDSPPIKRSQHPTTMFDAALVPSIDSPTCQSQGSATQSDDALVPFKDTISTRNEKSAPMKVLSSPIIPTEKFPKSRSPELPTDIKCKSNSPSMQKQLSPRGDLKKTRRRPSIGAKNSTLSKRWM